MWDRWGTYAERRDVLAGDQEVQKYYICEECKAELEGITVRQARRAIRGPRCASDVLRAKNYAEARRRVQTQFQVGGVKMLLLKEEDAPMRKRELRDVIHRKTVLAVADMKTILQPLAAVLWTRT